MTVVSVEDVGTLDVMLQRLAMTVRRQMSDTISAFDLTVAQYLALMSIYRAGSSRTMSELADETMQISATMTGIINRLEKRGWVRRELDPSDRRVWRVDLTTTGKQQIEVLEAERQTATESLFCQLSPQEREEFQMLIDKYLAISQ